MSIVNQFKHENYEINNKKKKSGDESFKGSFYGNFPLWNHRFCPGRFQSLKNTGNLQLITVSDKIGNFLKTI